nr:Fe-S cluster assembly ATPase SufC [Ureaplasma sp.]
MMKIKLKNLKVSIENNCILNDINLEINQGDVMLILGPNGHGKSTILKSIMRHYDTKIDNGEIIVNDEIINNLTTDIIANKFHIYFAVQNPVEIPGLTMIELLRNEASKNGSKISTIELFKNINNKMQNLQLNNELLSRSVNSNFSGGEKKKSEIIQMEILNPDIILLDEIDSGLDVDAVDIIGESLKKQKQLGKTIIFISHNERLLEKIVPNKVAIIFNGKVQEVGGLELAKYINKIGYKNYAKEKNITLENFDDEFLKDTNKGYS